MKVLSLFDGMSCARIALDKAGVVVDKYYSSEIDKFAIKVSEENYPDIVRLGNILDHESWVFNLGEIDLIVAGFPCQAWSMAGHMKGIKDERGKLFYTMLDVMQRVKMKNPTVKFIIENVKMKKDFESFITEEIERRLGSIHKILINSALVSAQNRNRYYWTNFETSQPQDAGIKLEDILDDYPDFTLMSDMFINRNKKILFDIYPIKARTLTASDYVKNGRLGTYLRCGSSRGRYIVDGKRADNKVNSLKGITEQRLELRNDEKTNTLTTVQKDNLLVMVGIASDIKGNYEPTKRSYSKTGKSPTLSTCSGGNREPKVSLNDTATTDIKDISYRKLSPLECERLQTVPDGFTSSVSNSQRYKMLANGFTVDVIKHLIECMNTH